MMAAPFVWLFGPSYWYGRLLGFLASLVSAGAIAYAVYRDGERQRWIAASSGLGILELEFRLSHWSALSPAHDDGHV